ncbi:MAG: GDP-mannose:cellobiosyl-diphosphopolyprenol alpha-mannosyltransferase [Verrucomicrobiota bacterium]|jgi:glycosyltransferase involved in cell wall biosynthesis
MLDVLHVTASLDPRHGGPSRTVPALASAQAELGAYVNLVTVGPVPPDFSARYPHLPVHAFPARPGPLGRICACASGLADFLRQTPTRAIHVHGLWQRPLHYAAAAATHQRIPLIVAPRGMLEPWALDHHTWKKRLAATFVHSRALASVSGWHATSPQEAENLNALPAWLHVPSSPPPAPCCLAPNGVTAPEPGSAPAARAAWLTAYPQLQNTRIALFYGRLHRKKRVAELIALWRAITRPGWTLLIAGIPGDYTIDQLQALAPASTSSPIVVADGTALPAPYPLAELFLLPSHSENFGQAVAEALAAGLPALVTDTLPWRELDTVSAGRCVPWSEYPAALAALLAQPSPALAALGAQGRTWVLATYPWSTPAQNLLKFYSHLASPSTAPVISP